jgi:hypothetical protein
MNELVAVTERLYNYFQNMLSSNLTLDTGYPDWSFPLVQGFFS